MVNGFLTLYFGIVFPFKPRRGGISRIGSRSPGTAPALRPLSGPPSGPEKGLSGRRGKVSLPTPADRSVGGHYSTPPRPL